MMFYKFSVMVFIWIFGHIPPGTGVPTVFQNTFNIMLGRQTKILKTKINSGWLYFEQWSRAYRKKQIVFTMRFQLQEVISTTRASSCAKKRQHCVWQKTSILEVSFSRQTCHLFWGFFLSGRKNRENRLIWDTFWRKNNKNTCRWKTM